jgi:ABC-2 type transport system permease protein
VTMGHLVRGAALVATQEFRMRLRTGRWRWLLGSWVLVLAVFTALVDYALGVTGTLGAIGVPMFGILMLFVLGVVLLTSPALTAQSINGDRERGTLATLQITRLSPAQIALGKLAASWSVGLVALALTLPFVAWSMINGGLTVARVGGVLAITALLMGVVCAISQALSALLARSITSALLSYIVVFVLTAGTAISFGLANALVLEQRQMQDGYTESLGHPEKVWWLLAPNPFVVLADSAPQLPPRVTVRGDSRVVVEPDDPLSGLGRAVRQSRAEHRYDGYYDDNDGFVYREPPVGPPVWPWGLGFDLALAAGSVWITIRRLRAPSRRIARGVRIG